MQKTYTPQDFDEDLLTVLTNLKSFVKTGVDRAPTAAHVRIVDDHSSDMGLIIMPDLTESEERNEKMLLSIGYIINQTMVSEDVQLINPELKAVFFVADAWMIVRKTKETKEAVIVTGYMPGEDLINFAQITVERNAKGNYVIIDEDVQPHDDIDIKVKANASKKIVEGYNLTEAPRWLVETSVEEFGDLLKTNSFYNNVTQDISDQEIKIDKSRLN